MSASTRPQSGSTRSDSRRRRRPRPNARRGSRRAKARGRALASARAASGATAPTPTAACYAHATGFIQGYNAQVAVGESHVVLACAVSQENGDNRLLEPMVMRTEQALQAAKVTATPGIFLADGGYWSGSASRSCKRKEGGGCW